MTARLACCLLVCLALSACTTATLESPAVQRAMDIVTRPPRTNLCPPSYLDLPDIASQVAALLREWTAP